MDIHAISERVRLGDSNAFEPIIHAYQQKLFAYCFYMLGNRQEAEDAVQEAFIRAYQALPTYRVDLSFSAWLYKIAGNHCMTVLGRRKRWHSLLPMFRMTEQQPSAEAEVWKLLGDRTADLLKGLTPEEKQIVILHVIEEQSLEQVAQLLHVKPAAVRKRFERIRKKLRKSTANGEESGYEQSVRMERA